MDNTPNLGLPYILAAHSQKHVTHNEAIRALDAIVQLAVLDRDLAAPPVSPAEGDRYIVAASPTGDWDGQVGNVAAFKPSAVVATSGTLRRLSRPPIRRGRSSSRERNSARSFIGTTTGKIQILIIQAVP